MTRRWAHISLKWSAHPDDVADYIAHAVRRLGLEGFTSTEGKGRRRAVARKLGPEWRVQSRGEFLIGTRRKAFGRRPTLPLPRYRHAKGADWSNGPHAGPRRFAAMFGNYRDRATRRRVRVIVTHAPSHVQVGGVWRDLPHRVRPYQRGMAWLGGQVQKVGHHRNVTQLVCMDSNLDQHLITWRTYLTGLLGLPSIYTTELPHEGTEGHRLIDTCHTNARVSNVRVVKLPRAKVLDHDLVTWDVGL